jgi:hypothetical protein
MAGPSPPTITHGEPLLRVRVRGRVRVRVTPAA